LEDGPLTRPHTYYVEYEGNTAYLYLATAPSVVSNEVYMWLGTNRWTWVENLTTNGELDCEGNVIYLTFETLPEYNAWYAYVETAEGPLHLHGDLK